jgi:hypothetical protein
VGNSSLTFLFHRPEFIFRHPEDDIIVFEADHTRIYFSRSGNLLTSLDRSPFGSFVMTPDSQEADLYSLVEKMLLWSAKHGTTNLVIRSFPEIYQSPHNSLIRNVLVKSGFGVKYEDITQVIEVSAARSMKLNIHKQRRIRQAESLSFSFRQLPVDYLDEAYERIVESRESKGYPITMTLKDLKVMFRLFPDEYLLFGVFDQSKLIAAAVCIKVNSEILYCFYVGDALAYRHHSPVTLLTSKVFEYCRANHFKMLDLGMSTDKGILNKGLYAFKKSFGSIESRKLTFLKQL